MSSAVYQELEGLSPSVWYQFLSAGGPPLLLAGTATNVVVYGWRGVVLPIQTLPGVGVAAIASFSPSAGVDVVVVANGGSAGARETSSHVYILYNNTDQFSLVSGGVGEGVAKGVEWGVAKGVGWGVAKGGGWVVS